MWLAVLKLLAQLQCLSDIWTWVVCQTPLEYCSVRWQNRVSSCVHLANCHTLVYESCCWTSWNLLGSLSQIFSLRSGGATAAAQAGIPDRLFKRHGHWSSDSAKDGYGKDLVASLLEVTQRLGI